MQLQPVTFESETDIRYEFKLETSDEKPRFWCILVAKFAGHYRPGHRGAPDAYFIQGITRTALGVWSPAALILDLRELSYTWGDEMDYVLSVGAEGDLPTAIVGSGLCLPAIGTLIHGINSTIPATNAENIFENIEEAWDYVHRKV
jgi:hypothetical protein